MTPAPYPIRRFHGSSCLGLKIGFESMTYARTRPSEASRLLDGSSNNLSKILRLVTSIISAAKSQTGRMPGFLTEAFGPIYLAVRPGESMAPRVRRFVLTNFRFPHISRFQAARCSTTFGHQLVFRTNLFPSKALLRRSLARASRDITVPIGIFSVLDISL